MTALRQYARLESPGLWRDAPAAQRREVVVAFREATLVLSDPRSDVALSHWSLPAVERLNPGQLPALYAPCADETSETLELDDPTMIAALETVRNSIAGHRPRPGRLRGFLLGGGTLLVVGLALFWLPDALRRHTAAMLPTATRAAISQTVMQDLQRLTGSPCSSPVGTYALTTLGDRLFGQHKSQILILRDGLERAAHLPGGVVLIGRDLAEKEDGPEVLAGFALAERLRAETRDPILPVLEYAGLTATFRLLTTGVLPSSALSGYGEQILKVTPMPLEPTPLLDRFQTAGIASTPYAYALDPTGESSISLVEADPLRDLIPEPLMPDGDWVALQDICSN